MEAGSPAKTAPTSMGKPWKTLAREWTTHVDKECKSVSTVSQGLLPLHYTLLLHLFTPLYLHSSYHDLV